MTAPSVPWTATAFGGRCPKCGQGDLYAGAIKLAPRCESCGLDLGPYDQGDGPAVPVTLVVGFLVVAAGIAVELNYEPPLWVHLALWVPAILVLSILFLRWVKGLLVHQQFTLKATDEIEVE